MQPCTSPDPFTVMPAKAGIREPVDWTPAFAGVTADSRLRDGKRKAPMRRLP